MKTTYIVAVSTTLLLATAARTASLFGPGGSILPDQTNVNQILYHNYENLFDSSGNRVSNSTPIVAGDYVVGILNLDQISPPGTTVGATFGTPTSPPGQGEITGVFAQQVTSIVGNTITFTTANKTSFVDSLSGPATTINTGLAANEMFRFYQDNAGPGGTPTLPFAATGVGVTLASSVNSATNGNLLFSLGFAANPAQGDPNAGYFYSIINNPSPTALAITGYGGLNFVANNTGTTFSTVFDTSATTPTPVGLILESSITPDNTIPSPWDFASHDPADVSVAVPLPPAAASGATLLVMLGAAAMFARRNARAAANS